MRADRKRNFFQLLFGVLFNGYILGFAKGKIFKGKTKLFCVPVLNCHSCPGATGSCPLGSLQTVLAGGHLSFYVLGTIFLFGILFGRLICGFLCPFGFIQELLHKIPTKKAEPGGRTDRIARMVKYVLLAAAVLIIPFAVRDASGQGIPAFCAYICPAGTLEAGIPLVSSNEQLSAMTGAAFIWKIALLAVMLVWSVFTYRPFCRYLCPLGAMYGLFNRFSLYQYEIDKDKCSGCGTCSEVCGMRIDVKNDINSRECIRCGRCVSVCPENAITRKRIFRAAKETEEKGET